MTGASANIAVTKYYFCANTTAANANAITSTTKDC